MTLDPSLILTGESRQEETMTSDLSWLAAMLGWGNTPPQATLEAEIRALKARAREATKLTEERNTLRTALKEYGQHKADCLSQRCQFVYGPTNTCNQPSDSSDHDLVWGYKDSTHAFAAGQCTCGFAATLATGEDQ